MQIFYVKKISHKPQISDIAAKASVAAPFSLILQAMCSFKEMFVSVAVHTVDVHGRQDHRHFWSTSFDVAGGRK